jgi:hypothetical protein
VSKPTLEGCPNPYRLPGGEAVLCGCRGDDEERPRHWVYDGVPLFCRCAPREYPDVGSGLDYGANDDGYACRACADRLPDRSLMRRLNCDMWCCWCGGLAQGNHGYRISGHPAPREAGR